MDKQAKQPPEKGGFLSILLTLVGFFLFVGLVAYVWIGREPADVWIGGASPEERLETLREHREREREALTEYGWIDQDQGIVRLPVEQAMDLVLEEMNQEQNQN